MSQTRAHPATNRSHSRPSTVIFDWGRTLFDREKDGLFPETVFVLENLSKRYNLTIASLATSEPPEVRIDLIRKLDLDRFFDLILVDSQDKDEMYIKTIKMFDLRPSELAIIDDRVIRGIAWGNKIGATTIWLRRGKFANELPGPKTGEPTHVIRRLSEVLNCL